MKKLLSLLLIVAMLLTMVPVAFAQGTFKDINSSHWAYSAVSRLVTEGTINGFPDGTFRPDATVSRAEFVKMIGKTSTVTKDVYIDVNAEDWFYEYVMASGLKPTSYGVFEPNTPIKRGDVAELLWSRNGSSTSEKAPYMIQKQHENSNVSSWVYNKGIMVGDDYVDLRLDDSLTRAEAAVLIIRARENVNNPAKDVVSNFTDDTYKVIYDSLGLSDIKPYSADSKFTHGELALMTLRLATDNYQVLYDNFSKMDVTYEHKYADPMGVYASYCIGKEKNNAQYIDQNATLSETITAVMFALAKSSTMALNYGAKDNYYKDAKNVDNEMINKLLTMAYNYNVLPYADGTLKGDKEVTLKELACVLLMADEICGFNRSNIYGVGKSYSSHSIRKNIASYPQCAEDYSVILSDVPNEVYAAPYIIYDDSNEAFGIPKYATNNAKDFELIFTAMLDTMAKQRCDELNNISIEYIPSMIVNNGDGYTYRVKIFIKSKQDNMKLSDLFTLYDGVTDFELKKHMVIWADIETGTKLQGIQFTPQYAGINQVIKTILP